MADRSQADPTPPGFSTLVLVFLTSAASICLFVPALIYATRSPAVGGAYFGIYVGSNALLATWAALGTHRFWTRQLGTIVSALVLGVCLHIGLFGMMGNGFDLGDCAGFLALLPTVMLAAQMPLWIARMLLGWRIVPVAHADSASAPSGRQFNIAQLMFVTAAIAVALTLGQWGGSLLARTRWAGVLVASVVSLSVSLLIILPCAGSVFLLRQAARGGLMTAVYAAMLTVAGFLLLASLKPGAPPELIGLLGGLATGVFGSLWAGLFLLRRAGYHMVRSQRSAGSLQPDVPAPSSALDQAHDDTLDR
jgi:hypothetical protein